MKIKQKVTIDGQEREIEIELDDNEYLTREQHEFRLKQTVEKRLARQATSIRTELLKDEEFVADVLKAKGIDPNKPGGKQLAEAEVIRIQEELRRGEVTPLKEKLTAIEGELGSEREERLVSSIESALVKAGAKKAIASRIAKIEATRFGWEAKSKSFAVKKGEEFEFSGKATADRPYKGIEEFAEEWAKDKENADFIEDTRQRGPDAKPGTGGGTSVRSKKDLKTDEQKVAFIREHGHTKYTELPVE